MPQSLSFPDQSHINRVRDALWERPNGRASIMVGAGFSRNADSTTRYADDFPLWRDIAEEMFKRLYPQGADTDTAVAYDALKLAQEYETGFGRSDLHKFLQELVRDNEYNPGDMHRRLLGLPWRDVFTTNWDTLLERTAPLITARAYSVVQNMDEIPLKGQPRIVKLHGSFPAQFPLIFTEEDYRTYPTKFAPFVNTVQQAMMETVFCLIGFSGDDPNFLQWSGWVRDNLGAAAPKIYLAGWLSLSNHRRRMLEDRGVVPIDLARHPRGQQWPEHLRHQYATQWVLHTLENGKPYDLTTWPSTPKEEKPDIPEALQPVEELISAVPQAQPELNRSSESSEELVRIKETLDVWKHNRQLYPGWLAFPSGQERGELSRRTNEWEQPILNALPELEPVERLSAIRELIWRREILLEPLFKPLIRLPAALDVKEKAWDVLKVVDCENRTIDGVEEARGDWAEIREAWRTVGLALLTAARIDCKRALFEQRFDALEPFANDHVDVAHRLQHERCLWDIFSLDFESLNRRLDIWEVVNSDPIWMLRKAALLTEAGRTDESKSLVQDALNLIRRNYARNSSIANASREGWALASALTTENQQVFIRRWDELASLKCGARQEIDLLSRRIRGNEERDEAPAFDLGIKRSAGIRISNEKYNRVVAAYSGLRLMEVGGLPPTNNPGDVHPLPMSITRGTLILAADKLADGAPDLAVRLVLRLCSSDTDKTLGRVLRRTRVATLSEDSAKTLAEICISAINYALPRLNSSDTPPLINPWIRRIRVSMEVLSRLVLRLPSDSVAAILEFGLDCLQNQAIRRNELLGRPISNLLKRSWDALPNELHPRYALRLLAMSLERPDTSRHLDPGSLVVNSDISLVRSSGDEEQYQGVVKLLISSLRSEDDEVRERAIIRLMSLVNSRCLTENEIEEIASALWAKKDPILDNSTSTKLLESVYFLLPELNPGQADRSFRKKWLTLGSDLGEDMALAENVLEQVGMALDMSMRHDYSLPLSSKEQKHLLACVLKVAKCLSKGPWSFSDFSQNGINYGIRSTLDNIEIPKGFAEQLYEAAVSMREASSASEAFPFAYVNELKTVFAYAVMLGLIKALPERAEDISGWIRLGLASDDDLQVTQAMSTLRSWMSASASDANSITPPPDDLVREIGVVIATRRKVALHSALSVAIWIFDNGDTKHQETISRLVLQGLYYLIEELRYDRRDHDYDDEDIPTLRLLCVQLANSMAQKGYANEIVISRWLEIAGDDPLPEVRYAVASDEEDMC